MKPFAEDSRPIASQGKAELARETEKVEIFFDSIYASSANFIPTYPGGRTRTAALVPEVRMRRIGWPVTRLFQEYGSATSKPGVGGTGFSSTWAASLGSAKNREQKQSTCNTETLVYTTQVGSHAHSLKWSSILFHNIWIKNLCHTSKKKLFTKKLEYFSVIYERRIITNRFYAAANNGFFREHLGCFRQV